MVKVHELVRLILPRQRDFFYPSPNLFLDHDWQVNLMIFGKLIIFFHRVPEDYKILISTAAPFF